MYLHCLIAAPTYGLFVCLVAAGPLVYGHFYLLLTGWLLLMCTDDSHVWPPFFSSAMNDCTDTCAGKVSNLTR